jgi:SNF2 family DNA or RNA helicase
LVSIDHRRASFVVGTSPFSHFPRTSQTIISGKTMQTIGLLAALFRKTGTGADLIELHRRARMAEFFKIEIEEAKQQALEEGQLYTASPQRNAPSTELEWGPVLILAPSSVLEAWVKSLKVWGHFSVALYQNGERKDILENVMLGSVEILVASHTRIQSDESATSLREIPWKLVIIDEFHKMKNVNSCLAKNLRLLRDAHAETVLLGLTGTMMQNDHKVRTIIVKCSRLDFLFTDENFLFDGFVLTRHINFNRFIGTMVREFGTF